MGKETKRKRKFAILHRLRKKEKMGKLKTRYQTADSKERERILTKVRKISPGYSTDLISKAK
jgi:hypothetical protein